MQNIKNKTVPKQHGTINHNSCPLPEKNFRGTLARYGHSMRTGSKSPTQGSFVTIVESSPVRERKKRPMRSPNRRMSRERDYRKAELIEADGVDYEETVNKCFDVQRSVQNVGDTPVDKPKLEEELKECIEDDQEAVDEILNLLIYDKQEKRCTSRSPLRRNKKSSLRSNRLNHDHIDEIFNTVLKNLLTKNSSTDYGKTNCDSIHTSDGNNCSLDSEDESFASDDGFNEIQANEPSPNVSTTNLDDDDIDHSNDIQTQFVESSPVSSKPSESQDMATIENELSREDEYSVSTTNTTCPICFQALEDGNKIGDTNPPIYCLNIRESSNRNMSPERKTKSKLKSKKLHLDMIPEGICPGCLMTKQSYNSEKSDNSENSIAETTTTGVLLNEPCCSQNLQTCAVDPVNILHAILKKNVHEPQREILSKNIVLEKKLSKVLLPSPSSLTNELTQTNSVEGLCPGTLDSLVDERIKMNQDELLKDGFIEDEEDCITSSYSDIVRGSKDRFPLCQRDPSSSVAGKMLSPLTVGDQAHSDSNVSDAFAILSDIKRYPSFNDLTDLKEDDATAEKQSKCSHGSSKLRIKTGVDNDAEQAAPTQDNCDFPLKLSTDGDGIPVKQHVSSPAVYDTEVRTNHVSSPAVYDTEVRTNDVSSPAVYDTEVRTNDQQVCSNVTEKNQKIQNICDLPAFKVFKHLEQKQLDMMKGNKNANCNNDDIDDINTEGETLSSLGDNVSLEASLHQNTDLLEMPSHEHYWRSPCGDDSSSEMSRNHIESAQKNTIVQSRHASDYSVSTLSIYNPNEIVIDSLPNAPLPYCSNVGVSKIISQIYLKNHSDNNSTIERKFICPRIKPSDATIQSQLGSLQKLQTLEGACSKYWAVREKDQHLCNLREDTVDIVKSRRRSLIHADQKDEMFLLTKRKNEQFVPRNNELVSCSRPSELAQVEKPVEKTSNPTRQRRRGFDFVARSNYHLEKSNRIITRCSRLVNLSQTMVLISSQQMANVSRCLNNNRR